MQETLTIWFDAVKAKPVREGWYEFRVNGSSINHGKLMEYRKGRWRSVHKGYCFMPAYGDQWRGVAGGFTAREGDRSVIREEFIKGWK